jgi:endonuclease/exonuclease/phosphatase family metal-dependent hydrolase
VLALQEVDREARRSGNVDLAAVVAGAMGATVAFGESIALGTGSYGNALVVRGEITSSEVLRLPRYRWSVYRREARTALIAHVVVDGVDLTVAATHLGVPQRENRPQLRALLGHLVAHPEPVVLLGDCNMAYGLAAPMFERAGYAVAAGAATFPAARPVMRIDHVAVRGGAVIASEVVRTPISDHRAVTATIDL